MKPRWHFFLSALFSFLLYLFNFSFLDISLFFLASFFIIDLDHVPRFIIKEKSINPFRFYKWCQSRGDEWGKLSPREKRLYKKPLYFFHNIETLLVLTIISLVYPIIKFIAIGFIFHLACDFIHQHYHKEEKHYKLFLIYTIIKNKNGVEFN